MDFLLCQLYKFYINPRFKFEKSKLINRFENFITNKPLFLRSNLHKLKYLMTIQNNIFILIIVMFNEIVMLNIFILKILKKIIQ